MAIKSILDTATIGLAVTSYEVHCDKCPEHITFTNVESFHELLELMKKHGWQSVKTDLGWDNLCPVCAEGK